ncbi:AAA domain-containing protein [Clostridium oceanicum]|uniref:AAA domain-containing protein n=1 Tax=Clostridium oceanicum TaxID=1543 RepID=A0ABN1JPL4_9CLOT
MDYTEKIKNIFRYLSEVRKINDKRITHVKDYEKVYTEKEIIKNKQCSISNVKDKGWVINITKDLGEVYNDLLKYYMDVKEKGDRWELVLGQAILACNKEANILHPMITTTLNVEFDISSKTFSIIPSKKCNLEISMYDFLSNDKFNELLKLKEYILKHEVNIRDRNQVKSIVDAVMDKIECLKEYQYKQTDSLDLIDVTDKISVYDCPLIIIRKKNTSLWTFELNSMIEELDKGYPVPKVVKAIVEEKKLTQDEEYFKQWENTKRQILFPLPSNDEQKEVAKRIAENYGVVVQGPPGTGKSQTIANLICHFLAHGKRVLVTSERGKALRVLSNKLPNQIKSLCVSLLDNDKKSIEDFENSIKDISKNLCQGTKGLKEDISLLEIEMTKCKNKQKKILSKLKEIDEIENRKINDNGKYYKLIEIGKMLKENKKDCDWIKDEIRYDDIQPVTDRQFNQFVSLLKNNNTNYIVSINNLISIVDRLPDFKELKRNIERLDKLQVNIEKYNNQLKGWYIPAENRCNYNNLVEFLDGCKKEIVTIEKDEVFKSILSLYYSSDIFKEAINSLVLSFNSYIKRIKEIRKNIDSHVVKISRYVQIDNLSEDYRKMYHSISSKGKITKLFKIFNNKYDYIFKECTIDGKSIKNLSEAKIMKDYIEQERIFKIINTLWENVISKYIGVKNYRKITNPIELESILKKISIITGWNRNYRDKIISILAKIRIPPDIDWYKSSTYDYLEKSIKCIERVEEYNDLKAYIDILKKQIDDVSELEDLIEAIDKRNLLKIEESYSYINKIKDSKDHIKNMNRIYDKLVNCCPKTLKYITSSRDISKFTNWSKSWKWAQYNSLFNFIDNLDEKKLLRQLKEQMHMENLLVREMVAKKSWYNLVLNITEKEKRSLFSWVQAVKRIGKGRGKFTLQYSKLAQEELEKCKSAIPVWIMPLNRIIENMKVSRDLFDVVIFDESSQSNIFSICALMRGKKAIIVGDDKQISPENVGVDQKTVNNLIDKYLKDIPHNQWLDLQTSLYDTALRVFPNRIMLKEHFRSVPEIIGFSNKECYSDIVVPLRYVRSNEMFNPAINLIHVSDGYRDKTKQLNVNEAEAIANRVIECCKNPKYNNMTMGVISLLGETQSQYIEDLLRESLTEEELINRRLICGDAYSFQGDERDIMFLSMVVADNVKYTALTKESDIRRFNVASSRARNQMFIFYSVDIESLSSNCVRYKLLNYCKNYKNYKTNLPSIEYVAQSKLQRDVYGLIKKLGYCIKPQIKIGKHKIDFVIEGDRTRVGIICDDGNLLKYNTLEDLLKFQISMSKLGWHFYKIRGCEFYRDPDKEIGRLCDVLNNIGIDNLNCRQSIKDGLHVV